MTRNQSSLRSRGTRRTPLSVGSATSPSPAAQPRTLSRARMLRPKSSPSKPLGEVRPSSSFGVLSSHSFSGGRLAMDIKTLRSLPQLTEEQPVPVSSASGLHARDTNIPAPRERRTSVSVSARKASKKGRATTSKTDATASSKGPAPAREAPSRRKRAGSSAVVGLARSCSALRLSRRGGESIDAAEQPYEQPDSRALRSRPFASPPPSELVRTRQVASRFAGGSAALAAGAEVFASQKAPLKQHARSGTSTQAVSLANEPTLHVASLRTASVARRSATAVPNRRHRSRGCSTSLQSLVCGVEQRENSPNSSCGTGAASSESGTPALSPLVGSALSVSVPFLSTFPDAPLRLGSHPPSSSLSASSDDSASGSRKASSTSSLWSGAPSAAEQCALPEIRRAFMTVGVCATAAPGGRQDGQSTGSNSPRQGTQASSEGASSSDRTEAGDLSSRLESNQYVQSGHSGRGPLSSGCSFGESRFPLLPPSQPSQLRNPGTEEIPPQALPPGVSQQAKMASRGVHLPRLNLNSLGRGKQAPVRRVEGREASGDSKRDTEAADTKGTRSPDQGVRESRLRSPPASPATRHPDGARRGLSDAKGRSGQTSASSTPLTDAERSPAAPVHSPGELPKADRAPGSARGAGKEAGDHRVAAGGRRNAERTVPPKTSPSVPNRFLPRRSVTLEISPQSSTGPARLGPSPSGRRASVSSQVDSLAQTHQAGVKEALLKKSAGATASPRAQGTDAQGGKAALPGGRSRVPVSAEPLAKKGSGATLSPSELSERALREQEASRRAVPQQSLSSSGLSKSKISSVASQGRRFSLMEMRGATHDGSDTQGAAKRLRQPQGRTDATSHAGSVSSDVDSARTAPRSPAEKGQRRRAGSALVTRALSGEHDPLETHGGQEPSTALQSSPRTKRPPLPRLSLAAGPGSKASGVTRRTILSPRGAAAGTGASVRQPGRLSEESGAAPQRMHLAAKASKSHAASARSSDTLHAGTLSPTDSLRTSSISSPRRAPRSLGVKTDSSRTGGARRATVTLTLSTGSRLSDAEVPSLRIDKTSALGDDTKRRRRTVTAISLSGAGDSAEQDVSSAGGAKAAPGKLARKMPLSPRTSKPLARSLSRAGSQLAAPGGKAPVGGKRPKGKASAKAATGARKKVDASSKLQAAAEDAHGEEQPAEGSPEAQHDQATPTKEPEFCVKDLPMPAERIQPRVYIPEGYFLPVRDAPELERSSLMRSFQRDLCRPAPRGVFDRTLYAMAMELSLLMPTDMKNMKRWLQQSVAEVERERKELIDVRGFLEVLPGFCMPEQPLAFALAYRDEQRWKNWGTGWMGENGMPMPLPPDKLLRAFFFAEGLEGGPDWECKMMKREEDYMWRFMKQEKEKQRKEEEYRRLLQKEAALQNLVRFKAKRWRQLQCMWEKLVEAIELHQQPRYSYVSSLDEGFTNPTSVARWLHPERQRVPLAQWCAASPASCLPCCIDTLTVDSCDAEVSCCGRCGDVSPAPSVPVDETGSPLRSPSGDGPVRAESVSLPSVVTISSFSELQARARQSESYARALRAMQQMPVMPSPAYIRHLFREKKFGELNTVFKALIGLSIEELWLHFDRQEAEEEAKARAQEAVRAAQAAAREAQARALAEAEARRKSEAERLAREQLEREEMANEDTFSHKCEAFAWEDGNLSRKKQEFLKLIPISPSEANVVEMMVAKPKKGTRQSQARDPKLTKLRRAGSADSDGTVVREKLGGKRGSAVFATDAAPTHGQDVQRRSRVSRQLSQHGLSEQSTPQSMHLLSPGKGQPARIPEVSARLVRMKLDARGLRRASDLV
ncbi:Proteophosphoglycan 5, related [Neospora caninum Liverpool]|nr:Proteophosphoglycan 5, related [Neospora caninum Liverpool]CBZ53178.1 Proteophosphoglycan 5, related [Neospora caninum Liverpool]|eukprot:XP_003883210.1 Proteophosphoglycan 5, related [Neospora caninum Liverpool]